MRIRTRSLMVAVALVTVAACGSSDEPGGAGTAPADAGGTTVAPATDPGGTDAAPATDAAPSTDPAPSTAGGGTAAAPEAIQFSAPLVGGGELDLSQFAGTTVALWFWAPT